MFKNNRDRHLDEILEHFRLEQEEGILPHTENLPEERSAKEHSVKECSGKEVTFNLNHSTDQEKKTK